MVSIKDEMRHVRTNPILLVNNNQLTAFTFAALALALTMLVAFMCDTPILDGTRLDFPRVSHPHSLWHAQREDALVVAILRTGDVFFGDDKLDPDTLTGKMLARVPLTRERKVYIRAEARVPWKAVARVVDAARSAGIAEVEFFADQNRTADER